MNAHFMAKIYGWSLALGSLIVITLIILIAMGIETGHVKNPAAPFIRAFERNQVHRHRMQELKLRVQLAKTGVDPEYVKFMEEKARQS
jgi:hypothetical protein